MQCPHCGQSQHGVCLNCDKQYFQVGVTIHNDSAVAALKERKELTDKNNAEIKKLKKKIGRLQIFIAITFAVALLYLGWCNSRKSEPGPGADEETPVTRVTLFDSEVRLEVNEYIEADFSIEERRNLIINVSAECPSCLYPSLAIYLFDEDNYRRFEAHEPHDQTGSVDADSYYFNGPLDSGHYYVVLQNTSDSEEIVIKIKASLIYKQENPGY
jgi:hypothetical protein